MEKVRIQDDLYSYVYQETIDNLVIPDDMPVTGGFATLGIEVEKLMMGEFEDMCKSGAYLNEYMERACALYLAAKNVKKKNRHGIKPALKYLSVIEKLDSIKTFNRKLPELMLGGYPLPFAISVGPDMKDTDHNCVSVQGPSVFLPDSSYYKPERAQQKEALMGLWTNVAKQIMAKTDLSEETKNSLSQFDKPAGNAEKEQRKLVPKPLQFCQLQILQIVELVHMQTI